MSTPRGRGRRPAAEDTRGAIVKAAREEFARAGYDAVSMRAIARAAGVDPALLHHYWEGKPALFVETVAVPIDPEAIVANIVDGPREGVGARAVASFFSIWDGPSHRLRFAALLRGAVGSEELARPLREFLVAEVFGRITRETGVEPGPLRAGLSASQLIGVATMRYVVELPPMVEASVEELSVWLGPTLQRYLAD